MKTSIAFKPVELTLKESLNWYLTLAFVAGNLLLPQLCHLIPNGGPIFLPIYFFTLIAAYKFGLKTGLLTAFLSPVLNSLLFGMPPVALLPIILIKSTLLAVAASLVAKKTKTLSFRWLALIIVGYQLVGGLAEWAFTASLHAATQDVRIGFPGMLIQLFGGWLLLRMLVNYDRKNV